MRVKEVCILVLILLTTLVYAAPSAVVNLIPVSLYESNERLFNVTVDNLFGDEVIEEVNVSLPRFAVKSVVSFDGWSDSFSDNEVSWYDGDIETNANALFQFFAQADIVGSDTVVDVDVITDGETTDTFQVTILNDDTPPALSDPVPSDGGYLREGITDQNVSIGVDDPETGIKNASFSYWDCSANVTNAAVHDMELTCAGNVCSKEIDFSEYEEGDSMCFSFVVYNNALDPGVLNGTVGFDGTPPSVSLLAPDNGSYGSNNTFFSFNATDNLAPILSCDFLVDDVSIDSVTATNGAVTSTTYDMSGVSEGNHNWKVSCTDLVGLSADSAIRTIIIDTTAPIITLNSPANGSIIGDNVIIDINVTDNYEVDTVDYSISLNSSELPEGMNVMVVTATDKAGNIAAAEFTFTVDRTAPTIALIAPGGSSDVHVSFIFDTDDNLDPTLDCSVYVDDVARATQEVDINATANITIILAMDIYDWYIACSDDAGNSVTSTTSSLNVTDLTGPDVVSDITQVARTEDYPFDVNITDISGIASVEIVFDGTVLNITDAGDIYSGIIQTDLGYALGSYSLIITANDTFANTNTLVDNFELVQGYALTLSLDPFSVEAGKEVAASGTVTLDDGGAVPEDSLILYLPGGTVNVSIDNGSYSYAFNAPGKGSYTIMAEVISSDGFTHSQTALLEVTAAAGSSSSSSSGGTGGGSRLYCGDGICSRASAANEDCNSCPVDCGECPAPKPKTGTSGSFTPVEEEIIIPPEEPREPAGVGAASSWFRSLIVNPGIWILFLLILGALYLMSSQKGKKSKINWKGYFDRHK